MVEYYQSFSSPVFVAFMDVSKAFDKINYFHLMSKLIDHEVPIIMVRLLLYWCCHQDFCVKCGGNISLPFRVTNGVRQGGNASPRFVNVYMDALSIILSKSNGCAINSCNVNHLFCADDSVLMAHSAKGTLLTCNHAN